MIIKPSRSMYADEFLLSAGNLVEDWWAQDLDATVADGGPISAWTGRKSGIVASATGTARPTLKKAWIGEKSYVKFNGTANLLLTTAFLDSTYNTAFTMIMARDYNGAEPAAANLNIFASNNAGSNTWLGQYDRFNSTVTLGNLNPSSYNFAASNGPVVEAVTFDGTTITYRQNGVVRTAARVGNMGLSGKLAMGGYEGAGFLMAGYLRRLLIYKQCLVGSDVGNIERELYADAGLRNRKLNYFLGDSQTLNFNATTTNAYPAYTAHSIGTAQNYTSNGVVSRTLADMYANYETEIRPGLLSSLQNRVVVRAGTNDLYLGDTGVHLYNSVFVPLCQKLRADGAKIIAVTVMTRSGFSTPAGFDTERGIYNALVKGTPGLVDGIVDVGNAVLYPEFSDSTNTTYFADLVHNTDLGSSIVATGNGNDGGVVAKLNAL